MNYYRYPVITNTKMEVLEELPFPAVTFCNQSPFNLSKVRAADPHLETYFNKVSLLGQLTGTLSLNWSEPGFDRPIYRESQTLDWWRNIHMSPEVILHDPRTHPDEARTSFLAAPGSTTNAVVQRSTYQYLPPPYQALKNRTCLDTLAPSFNNTLQYFDTYTYENCLRECITKMTHGECGCITPSDNEYVMRNATIQKECACQLPCSFATYDVKVSASKYPSDVSVNMLLDLKIAPDEEYIRENYLEIRIYYADLVVQSTEQIPRYTTETIIGNLGGQMGICLGASILTLTELGEFLLFLCLTIFRRRKHGGEAKDIKPTEH
ncbi:acid-sensing ion channel 1-like [Haliotis rufescens]|uniref:acid-sensing ion channel 1-like n=1 Tax=Haliotis rufescens TaxID=6454 RepID=UPI00201EF029|nr:acid-sensing ion channel 1-like [Haliotis rufescens]